MKSEVQKPTKTEFIGGGRGSSDGTIIIVPPVKKNGRVVEPERILVRVRRYGREKKRLAESRTHAKDLRHELIDEFKREQFQVVSPGAGKTFKDLADYYEKEYLHPPNKQGQGLKSWEKLKHPLQVLRDEFGEELVRSINYVRIADFKQKFAATKTRHKTERSLASVHRPLELLRRMLNVARHRQWFSGEPFHDGDPLVRKSKETKRMRILTHAEERNLLAQCKDARAHLKPALIFAIDTAARAGEQFGTRVSDVDLANGFIRVREKSAKTGQERIVPITRRLRTELLRLKPMKSKSLRNREALIFDFKRPKRSFAGALQDSAIEGFRWHDLRHTGTMRMLEAGVDPATAMKVTGHTNWTTFMRYVNLNSELMRGVATKLDSARSRKRA